MILVVILNILNIIPNVICNNVFRFSIEYVINRYNIQYIINVVCILKNITKINIIINLHIMIILFIIQID